MKKFTVILNTDYGYYHYNVKAKDFLDAEIKGKDCHEQRDGEEDVSVVAIIPGWPKMKVY